MLIDWRLTPHLAVFQIYYGIQNVLITCTNKTIGLATISVAMRYFFEIYVILKTLLFKKIIEKNNNKRTKTKQTEII